MKCPRCEQDNPSHALFCPKCGAPFHRLDGSAKPAPSYEDVQRCLTESLDQQTATSEGSLKVELQKFEARGPSEFEAAFSRMRRGGATECEMVTRPVPSPPAVQTFTPAWSSYRHRIADDVYDRDTGPPSAQFARK